MTSARLLIAALVTALIGASATPSIVTAAEQKWTEYKYKDDHFAISQPVAPKAEFKTEDRPGGKDVRHAYVFYPDGATNQDTIFVVQVASKIPKDPRSDDDLIQYAARNIPRDAQRGIRVGDVKGVTFMYDQDGTHKTLIRAFAHEGFTYIVQVITLKAKFPHPLQDQWMDSFHVLDAKGN